MAYKTFVHFDPANGEITAITTEREDHFFMRQARGEPVLEVVSVLDPRDYRVEVDLMRVVRKVEEG